MMIDTIREAKLAVGNTGGEIRITVLDGFVGILLVLMMNLVPDVGFWRVVLALLGGLGVTIAFRLSQVRASVGHQPLFRISIRGALVAIAIIALELRLYLLSRSVVEVALATFFLVFGVYLVRLLLWALAARGPFDGVPGSFRLQFLLVRGVGLGLLVYSLFFNHYSGLEDRFGFDVPLPVFDQFAAHVFSLALLLCVVPMWRKESTLPGRRLGILLTLVHCIMFLSAMAFLLLIVVFSFVDTQTYSHYLLHSREVGYPAYYLGASVDVSAGLGQTLYARSMAVAGVALVGLGVGTVLLVRGIRGGRPMVAWPGAFLAAASLMGCVWFLMWFRNQGANSLPATWHSAIQLSINQLPFGLVAVALLGLFLVGVLHHRSEFVLGSDKATKMCFPGWVSLALIAGMIIWMSPASSLLESSRLLKTATLQEANYESSWAASVMNHNEETVYGNRSSRRYGGAFAAHGREYNQSMMIWFAVLLSLIYSPVVQQSLAKLDFSKLSCWLRDRKQWNVADGYLQVRFWMRASLVLMLFLLIPRILPSGSSKRSIHDFEMQVERLLQMAKTACWDTFKTLVDHPIQGVAVGAIVAVLIWRSFHVAGRGYDGSYELSVPRWSSAGLLWISFVSVTSIGLLTMIAAGLCSIKILF